jgi:hypothetical protein
MSIATTADGQVLLLVASIAALFVVPISLWALFGVARVVRLITRVDLSLPLSIALVAAVPVGLLYLSLRLDEAGETRSAQVVDRAEQVSLRSDGDWRDDRALTLRYVSDGAPLTTVLHDTDPTTFEHTQVGSSFDLRVLRVLDRFSLVRPTAVSTSSLIPWWLIQPAAVVLGVGLVGWRLRRRGPGKLVLVALVVGAASYPLLNAAEHARQQQDLSSATQHTTASVLDVARVTRIDIGGSRRSDYHDVPRPYDIVQLQLREPGYVDPVLAVDAVDADDRQPLVKGASVAVVYPPDAPHDARLEGRARTHYFETTLGVYEDYALVIVGLLGVLVLIGVVGRVFRRRRPSYSAGGSIR